MTELQSLVYFVFSWFGIGERDAFAAAAGGPRLRGRLEADPEGMAACGQSLEGFAQMQCSWCSELCCVRGKAALRRQLSSGRDRSDVIAATENIFTLGVQCIDARQAHARSHVYACDG